VVEGRIFFFYASGESSEEYMEERKIDGSLLQRVRLWLFYEKQSEGTWFRKEWARRLGIG
jgi:hypothetical protein